MTFRQRVLSYLAFSVSRSVMLFCLGETTNFVLILRLHKRFLSSFPRIIFLPLPLQWAQIEKITDSKLRFRALALRQSMQTMSEFAVTKYYGYKRQLPRPYVLSWYFSPINSFYTSTFLQHYYLKKKWCRKWAPILQCRLIAKFPCFI